MIYTFRQPPRQVALDSEHSPRRPCSVYPGSQLSRCQREQPFQLPYYLHHEMRDVLGILDACIV